MICLSYYDKSYERGLKLHDPDKVIHIPVSGTDPLKNAKAILNIRKKQAKARQKEKLKQPDTQKQYGRH
jgi:hypothetical protein